jgi:hypothetical protein
MMPGERGWVDRFEPACDRAVVHPRRALARAHGFGALLELHGDPRTPKVDSVGEKAQLAQLLLAERQPRAQLVVEFRLVVEIVGNVKERA